MMETYRVQGKEVQLDPSLEHLVPATLYDRGNLLNLRARVAMEFAPVPIVALLKALDEGLGGPLGEAVKFYLEECRRGIDYVRSTQDIGQTQKIVEEGPVIPPSQLGNTKILEGLENTIRVLEQLGR